MSVAEDLEIESDGIEREQLFQNNPIGCEPFSQQLQHEIDKLRADIFIKEGSEDQKKEIAAIQGMVDIAEQHVAAS